MGLLDNFLQRGRAGATPAAASATVMTGEQAEEARVRARRRLIGAIVLLGVGVIAFPLLFETQPRPIPVDIPIVIPPRDGAPPLALPAPKAQPATTAVPATPAVETKTADAVPARPAAEPAKAEPVRDEAVRAERPKSETAKPELPRPEPPKAEPAKTEPPKREPAKAEPARPAEPPKPPTATAGRFVVQIGAFAEASAVRDARNKAQKAGLATFTQVVDTNDGKRTRVRVGPFSSREEAEKAAAQVKAAGLPGSVLAL